MLAGKQFRENEEMKAKAQISYAQSNDLIDFYHQKSGRKGASSSKFFKYIVMKIVPVFDKLSEAKKLDLLKTTASSLPYATAQDARLLLPSVVQLLKPEDFWFSAPKKGIMVFALPGEPGLAEVVDSFRTTFHDR